MKVKLFEEINQHSERIKPGAPPLVFVPPATGHIVFETHEDLKAWEEEVRSRLGVQLDGNLGSRSESCSAGCSDDCD